MKIIIPKNSRITKVTINKPRSIYEKRNRPAICKGCTGIFNEFYLYEGLCPECSQMKDADPQVTKCKNCDWQIIDSDDLLCDDCKKETS